MIIETTITKNIGVGSAILIVVVIVARVKA